MEKTSIDLPSPLVKYKNNEYVGYKKSSMNKNRGLTFHNDTRDTNRY